MVLTYRFSSGFVYVAKSRRRGSNPRPPAYEADALPLSYIGERLDFQITSQANQGLFSYAALVLKIQHPRIELGTFRVLGGRHNH